MSPRILRSINTLIESSSLPAFLIYIQFIDQEVTAQWLGPYLISTLVACFSTSYTLWIKRPLNRIFIGINGYFLSGLVGILYNVNPINQLYGILGASALLMWVTVVCLTFSIVDRKRLPRPKPTIIYIPKDYAFIIICALSTCFSWITIPNRILSEILPFTCVFILYGLWYSPPQLKERGR